MAEIVRETYEDICTFCNELQGDDTEFQRLGITEGPTGHILMESPSFAVVPCLGALTDWYVLVVPKRHVLSAGWCEPYERVELRSLLAEVVARLHDLSGHDVVIFEHGGYDFRNKGGACHDHCHIHVIATPRDAGDYVAFVEADVTLRPVPDWIEAAHEMLAGQRRAYLALEHAGTSMIAPADGAPSGFFRKSLARWLGEDPAQHDWLAYPQTSRLKHMIEAGL